MGASLSVFNPPIHISTHTHTHKHSHKLLSKNTGGSHTTKQYLHSTTKQYLHSVWMKLSCVVECQVRIHTHTDTHTLSLYHTLLGIKMPSNFILLLPANTQSRKTLQILLLSQYVCLLSVCMYVYIYICVFVYVCMHVCMYVCMYVGISHYKGALYVCC